MTDETTTPDIDTTQLEGQLTVQDILDTPEGDVPLEAVAEGPYHSILEIWSAIVSGAPSEAEKRITPQWATRMAAKHTGVRVQDAGLLQDYYFGHIMDLAKILQFEIETDDECLNVTSATEDVEHNSFHYKNVLITWQKQFLQWELEWDYTAEDAAIQVAALSEVHSMFFSPEGVTGLLDQINFQFTDADRETLQGELQALLDEAEKVTSE
jgi:hypothetical protein